MIIEIAIQNHMFEKRLCWMLSSIVEQYTAKDGVWCPHIRVNVAYVKNTGNPRTVDILDYFSEYIDIKRMEYPNLDRLQYRGLVRNDQTVTSSADWILYADADVVYPSNFFIELRKLLEGPYKDSGNCLYSSRKSNKVEDVEAMMAGQEYPSVIPNAFATVDSLDNHMMPNRGAGYCQIASLRAIRSKHEGVYQTEGLNKDWDWSKEAKPKSDIYFRKDMGGYPIPLPYQIHMNHVRDLDLGKHTDEQR